MFWICRFLLGGIFIYAASRKLAAPQELADSIAAYQMLPYPIVSLMALGLPLFELASGLLLITGYFCTTGLLSVISLLSVFLAALLSAIIRGLPLGCGCFGAQSPLEAAPWLALLRDGVLLAGAIYAYRHRLATEMESRKR